MKIRHFPPKAQGEVGLPEGGVGRPLPRHRLEKPPPQLPVVLFLFTGALLDLFKRHQSVVRYTVKAP